MGNLLFKVQGSKRQTGQALLIKKIMLFPAAENLPLWSKGLIAICLFDHRECLTGDNFIPNKKNGKINL